MQIHLVDGTYELFRSYFGAPPARSPSGQEVGATRGLLRSFWRLLHEDGATHVAVAFDHVIESFRNRLFADYKDGAGIEPELRDQFPLAERAAAALGLVVWPMIEFEADDAMAAAAHAWRQLPEVERILLCTPDKDLAQCVVGDRVVGLDRRRQLLLDEDGVRAKFGVDPASIPDWLAMVGDTADGIPGIPRWGAKSAATVLACYQHFDRIPLELPWAVNVRGAEALVASLVEHVDLLPLYRTLATLRTDVPIAETVADLAWRGARRAELEALCTEIGDRGFLERVDTFVA